MTDLPIIYRDWLSDGDAHLHDLYDSRGAWNVRADTDAWVTPDGRLLIDGEQIRPGDEVAP